MNLTTIIDAVTNVIRHPAANPRLSIVVGLVALLLVLLLLVVIMLLVPEKKKRVRKVIRRWVPDERAAQAAPADAAPEQEPEPEPERVEGWEEKPPSAPAPRPWWRQALALLSAASIPTLILAAVGFTYAASGSDQVCTQACHSESPAVELVHENDHAGRASCIECHEQGTGADLITGVTARAEMVLARFGADMPAQGVRPVASAACLRCHEDVLEGVAESSRVNIRVSHKEPLEAGMNCVECHGTVGHLGETARVAVSMEQCITCHDGETTSAACETCHTTDLAAVGRDAVSGDIQRVLGSGNYQYPPVTASDTDCLGCHENQEQCDSCHGLRLPHPESFVQGYHAKDAAFEKKEACWRCHDQRECQSCHSPFNVGHASNWKTDHTNASWSAGCGCHGRGTNVTTPICVFCHDNAPSQTVTQ